MTTPAANNAFAHAGQLAANCTSLATAYPHGGTALGLFSGVDVVHPGLFRIVMREEDNSPEDIIWLGGPVELVGSLKSWDADAVEKLFRGGSQPGAGVANLAFLATEIGRIPTKLNNIVWSPINTTYPVIVLRDVIAIPETTLSPRFSGVKFFSWRLRIIATNVDSSLGEIGTAAAVVL